MKIINQNNNSYELSDLLEEKILRVCEKFAEEFTEREVGAEVWLSVKEWTDKCLVIPFWAKT